MRLRPSRLSWPLPRVRDIGDGWRRHMKRLLRFIFTIVSLVSALLCLSMGALWIRSYWVGEYWIWYDQQKADLASNLFRIGDGRVQYSWYDVSRMTGLNPREGHYHTNEPSSGFFDVGRGKTHFEIPGLRYDRNPNFEFFRGHFAWPFALTALPPMLWLVLYR